MMSARSDDAPNENGTRHECCLAFGNGLNDPGADLVA